MAHLTHLHLGPGKLGLGLIVHTTTSINAVVHVLGRKASSVAPGWTFVIRLCDRSGAWRAESLPVAGFWSVDGAEDLSAELLRLLRDSPYLLVTTSLGTEGLSASADFVVDLARIRTGGNGALETVFIAAENDPGPRYASIVKRLTALDGRCCPTMVNRLCTTLVDNESEQQREAFADEVAEWVIQEMDGAADTLKQLQRAPHVLVVEDVDPYETRKRWLVNGAHLALALLARDANNLISIEAAAAEPDVSEELAELQRHMVTALVLEEINFENSFEYGQEQIAVWRRHHDEVARILKRLCRADPQPFLRDFDRKLAAPAQVLVRAGHTLPEQFDAVFDALHNLLTDIESYVDLRKVVRGGIALSEATDALALDLYRDLLAKVLPAADAEARVANLNRAWRRHRDRFG